MKIDFSKHFIKRYRKLRPGEQIRFKKQLEIFKRNPVDERLDNHRLKGGKYKGVRSIDIGGDLRALYILQGDGVVVFQIIGTHSQLYG